MVKSSNLGLMRHLSMDSKVQASWEIAEPLSFSVSDLGIISGVILSDFDLHEHSWRESQSIQCDSIHSESQVPDHPRSRIASLWIPVSPKDPTGCDNPPGVGSGSLLSIGAVGRIA